MTNMVWANLTKIKKSTISVIESEKSLIWIFIDAEIMENNQFENGTFEFVFLECGNPGRISFRYSKFEWCVVGEFNNEQIVQWYKENGLYKGIDEDI